MADQFLTTQISHKPFKLAVSLPFPPDQQQHRNRSINLERVLRSVLQTNINNNNTQAQRGVYLVLHGRNFVVQLVFGRYVAAALRWLLAIKFPKHLGISIIPVPCASKRCDATGKRERGTFHCGTLLPANSIQTLQLGVFLSCNCNSTGSSMQQ